MLTRKKVTFFKLETVYGTDSTPAVADAILTSEITVTPIAAGTVDIVRDRQVLGGDQALHIGVHKMIEFGVEMVGSGTLGTAPAWGKLLKACGCNETVVATTSVRYRPDDSILDSATIKYYEDGDLHTLLGARGSVSIQCDSQGLPYLRFRFLGLYVESGSAALPTGLTGWNAFQTPEPVNFANTPGITIDGYAGVLKAFAFDQGGGVVHFDDPGLREVSITTRASTGSVTILKPLNSVKNFDPVCTGNSLVGIKLNHGSTDARRVIWESVGRAQLMNPRPGDDQGRRTLQMDYRLTPSNAGGDDWEIRLAAA